MGMTMAEKILARASRREVVRPGEFITAEIDMAMCHDAMGMGVSVGMRVAGVDAIWNPEKVVCLLDHYVPAPSVKAAEMQRSIREDIKDFGIEINYAESEGVCHQVMIDKGHILPGKLIVGADSHTTSYGALGAAGTGIGISEMSYVLATGQLWFRVPETIRFEIRGNLQPAVMSKDIILYIAGKFTTEVAQYKSIEFIGPTIEGLSVDGRITMSNMSVELGAKFGFFETDEITMNYLERITDRSLIHLHADSDATYENIFYVDVNDLEPQVAMPYSVENSVSISKLEDIPIQQAILGSCTNGRMEDLRIAAKILKGHQVKSGVRMLVIPASKQVYLEALKENLLETFMESNAIVCNPGCGPCFGAHMGLLASGENCIASINRNFKGRMGSDESSVYLSSPATVAASAIEGKITDPRKYILEAA